RVHARGGAFFSVARLVPPTLVGRLEIRYPRTRTAVPSRTTFEVACHLARAVCPFCRHCDACAVSTADRHHATRRSPVNVHRRCAAATRGSPYSDNSRGTTSARFGQ